MDGIINIFKPKAMTSHDVVSIMRKILNTKKIGHTGTLDPNATGVLPICIGKATRVVEYLTDMDKEYISELTLGVRTDTQDNVGKVVSYSNKTVDEDSIIKIMTEYIGDIYQMPPMYSALKYKGKKLYELAREGKTVERAPRPITIYDLDILNIENNKKVLFHTKCSRGTYIRTLCDDIGANLGTYGYMSYLIRTSVGNFKIEDSYSIDYIKSLTLEEMPKILTPMDKALNHINEIIVNDELYFKLINGLMIHINFKEQHKLNEPLRVYCKGFFIGIGKILEKDSKLFLKMDKVLII